MRDLIKAIIRGVEKDAPQSPLCCGRGQRLPYVRMWRGVSYRQSVARE